MASNRTTAPRAADGSTWLPKAATVRPPTCSGCCISKAVERPPITWRSFMRSSANELRQFRRGPPDGPHDRGKPTGQEQYRRRVLRVNRTEGIVLQMPTGQLKALPPDLAYLCVARRGAYRLRSTGEVVPDPDFTTAWTWRPSTTPPAAGVGAFGRTKRLRMLGKSRPDAMPPGVVTAAADLNRSTRGLTTAWAGG